MKSSTRLGKKNLELAIKKGSKWHHSSKRETCTRVGRIGRQKKSPLLSGESWNIVVCFIRIGIIGTRHEPSLNEFVRWFSDWWGKPFFFSKIFFEFRITRWVLRKIQGLGIQMKGLVILRVMVQKFLESDSHFLSYQFFFDFLGKFWPFLKLKFRVEIMEIGPKIALSSMSDNSFTY